MKNVPHLQPFGACRTSGPRQADVARCKACDPWHQGGGQCVTRLNFCCCSTAADGLNPCYCKRHVSVGSIHAEFSPCLQLSYRSLDPRTRGCRYCVRVIPCADQYLSATCSVRFVWSLMLLRTCDCSLRWVHLFDFEVSSFWACTGGLKA